ncbi:MAG: BatA domain-containing protein, partial [Verrucomicrobiaceae bacterium]
MGFLNVMLLAGAAAFLVPLVIHLLNKRRVQIVRWGPMHLLHEALRQSRRNLKIEQLLLLLLRISIPIILALCLARPVLSALSHMPGMTKTSLVVLLDNSFSMRAPGAGGTVRDHAHEDLRRVLENLPRGSDASVILMGSPPRLLMDQPTTALDLIMQKLQTEPSLAGPLALHDALQIANAEIKRTGNASREVLVMSDFQQSDWRSLADGGTIAGLETLKQTQPAPQLTFFREEGDLQENLSLASLEPSAFVVAKDQTISLRTRIENHGKRAYQDLAVYLEADGARVRTTRVSVAPNAETVLNLTHSFDTAGEHSLTVRLEGDAFPDDNARSVVIPVREQVNCLLIGGAGTSAPLEGSTDFLQIALTPHRSAAATLKDVIQTNVV